MADDTDRVTGPVTPQAEDASAETPAGLEPWITPRVVAFERFERTAGPPDNFAMEGLFYGPS